MCSSIRQCKCYLFIFFLVAVCSRLQRQSGYCCLFNHTLHPRTCNWQESQHECTIKVFLMRRCIFESWTFFLQKASLTSCYFQPFWVSLNTYICTCSSHFQQLFVIFFYIFPVSWSLQNSSASRSSFAPGWCAHDCIDSCICIDF